MEDGLLASSAIILHYGLDAACDSKERPCRAYELLQGPATWLNTAGFDEDLRTAFSPEARDPSLSDASRSSALQFGYRDIGRLFDLCHKIRLTAMMVDIWLCRGAKGWPSVL